MAWLETTMVVMKIILRPRLRVRSTDEEREHPWELVRNQAMLQPY